MPRPRIGIWFIGARGGVATTSIVGLAALQRKLIGPTGLVSELPFFTHLPLAGWSEFVVGGHDVRKTTLLETAEGLVADKSLESSLLAGVKRDLVKFDKNIKQGTLLNVGDRIKEIADARLKKKSETPRDAVKRIQSNLKEFVRKQKLEHLVVVNVASTEPPVDERDLPRKWADLDKTLDQPRKCKLGASSVYAIAALDLGYPYVNFTPSLGSTPKAIQELAVLRETCHAGQDGKTGETLLKSVLAPLFAKRNLEVMSWVGHNIFGNLDSQVLGDPDNKRSKVKSKDRLLGQILGYSPQTLVTIEHIDSLGDWENGLGSYSFQGFSWNSYEIAIHVARLRLGFGRAAGSRSCPLYALCPPTGRSRRARLPFKLFQVTNGYKRWRLRTAISEPSPMVQACLLYTSDAADE